MSIKSPISKRLKEARLEADISQKQLGIKAGIDEFVASARMNQYETGKHVPDYDIVHQIAKALDIPAPFFYTDDKQLAHIIKSYGRLNKSQSTELVNFLNTLLNT